MPGLPFKILEQTGQTKMQLLVHSITEAVGNGELKEGDALPSVNQLSAESGFSRDTVFKAYSALKKNGLVESTLAKGYYVAGESYKVFMLLDDFSAFKEQLYNSFRQNLPQTYSVDLLFHHYNREVFQQLIRNSLGRYNSYVVMNIDHDGIDPALEEIDPKKLLILDMGAPLSETVSYIIQNFGESVESCLEKGWHRLKKYDELVLVYDEKETPHPSETVWATQRFCRKHNIRFKTVKRPQSPEIRKGQVWFTIRDADLVEVIKTCRKNDFKPGKDVGVLSYNDTPMKQIVGGGISVISTNFEQMGILAAGFIKNKQKIARVLPTSLILRESL
ncbi:GntR family transcriptional regulator [Mariniphaga sediminis]|uniref:GntR family transcriptional regulator n=1 Tax=Mariniphaga sediminis TaxID=1628158 RepID=UPI0011C4452D|nr:GntR family transcriptional regulator [Mariniphaga sediminis]